LAHPLGVLLGSDRSQRRQMAAILVNTGYSIKAAATSVGCSLSTVKRSLLCDTFDDAPRSGRPVTYSETFELKLTGFYCQTAPFDGFGRWTLRWAQVYLAAQPKRLDACPSKSTIQRILKKNNLKPHLSAYFLHITDPDFFPKMAHLLALYNNPPRYLFFFDECPGIQILKRLAPDLRTQSMMKRREAFEYIRNGTMNVLAFLSHADGKVYAECQADHKTDTLVAVFKRHVARCPINEQLHYVMDNLSTHTCYGYCVAVAELCHVACPDENELNTLQKRVNWLKSPDKRIVLHFTPYHGSWLNLVEHWFGIMNPKVLRGSYGSAEALKGAFEAFLALWNRLFAHTFNWRYEGKGLHNKAIKRFTQMLEHSADKLEIAMLTKQLRLMKNLFDDYSSEIDGDTWQKMIETLESQHIVLEKLIDAEEGPVRTEKAASALTSIMQLVRPEYNCDKLLAA
jgi:hypothetical protein